MPDKHDSRSVPLYGQIDERTRTIAYQGDAYAGRFLCFAVLFYFAYRGFRYHESNWVLFAMVMIASAISTLYQIKHKIISGKHWLKFMLIIGILAAIVAVLAAYHFALHRHG